jgi:hypothetical protein
VDEDDEEEDEEEVVDGLQSSLSAAGVWCWLGRAVEEGGGDSDSSLIGSIWSGLSPRLSCANTII